MADHSVTNRWALAGFALSVLVPSLGTIQKYLGNHGVIGYGIAVSCLLLVAYRYGFTRTKHLLTRRHVSALALCSLTVAVLGFAVLYPLANSGVVGGGSDADDALNLGVVALFHGNYPYHQLTYLGNALSPLPGAFLLASPFVFLGTSAYQNLFWIVVLFFFLERFWKDRHSAVYFLWAVLGLSPVVLSNIATGNDLVANTLVVLLFTSWTVESMCTRGTKWWKKIALSALLGVGLSWRANFLLQTPLVFSILTRKAGWKSAVISTMISCSTFALSTVPFWFYDEKAFPLLQQYGKLSQFQAILPFSGILIPVTAAVAALALSAQKIDNLSGLFGRIAIVQSIVVVSGATLWMIHSGTLSLLWTGYGVFFLFPGAIACWNSLESRGVANPN